MEIIFHGASKMVTGSCYQIKTSKLNILIDCGYFQGSREEMDKNWEPFSFDPSKIDYVFLTHAHLDHCGLLPKLVRHGFNGEIICTDATRDLAEIIIRDAYKIMNEDFERGRLNYANGDPKPLLYREVDIDDTMNKFRIYKYSDSINLRNDIEFRMRNAGHILGSSIFEFWIKENNKTRKIVFSGDLGQPGKRIIWDPDNVREADYVVLESTYGDRLHKDKNESILEFLSIVKYAEQKHGNILIPVFAIERTQEILYELNLMVEKGLLGNVKVYLDSPLGKKATEIFTRYSKYYDTDTLRLIEKGDNPFHFNGLNIIDNVQDSKELQNEKGAIILAGSGMCTGGRIVNHLFNNIEDPNARIVFVGYQVKGTLGRKLIDGAYSVSIFGQMKKVRAKIYTIGGLSAHADQRDLLYWLSGIGSNCKNLFLVHGDEQVMEKFANKIKKDLGINPIIPSVGTNYELE